MKATAMRLTPTDIGRLRQFRITEELIELHEIRRVTDAEARNDCGIQYRGDLSGVVYPIWGADGQVKGYRVRRDNPETEKGKPKNKYIMSADRPHLYFERTSRQYISDAAIPLILVESYSAALAIAAWCERSGQRYMVVATAGCWGWSGTIGIADNEHGKRVPEKGLSPDFSLIVLDGRTVYILFDSDISTNPKVRSSRKKLTPELHELKAVVRWPVIPQTDAKLGPDDFLALYSDQDFLALLETAKTAPKYEDVFKLTDDAVLRRIETEDKETGKKETSWRRICSYLDINAETRDGRSENWGRILIVKDRDGHLHEWSMPMSMLAADGVGYREYLLSLGLEIEPGKFAKEQLHQYISTARPEVKARCVTRIGWHHTPAGLVYVLPDATFGPTAGERVLLQSAWVSQHQYQSSGTLENWQRHVGRYCPGNSRLVLAVSLAFAPPLMELASEAGGGVHYRGPSSTGKTTALHMAGSVWGGGGIEGFIRNWRATSNGLEATAECHSDALLCLDELSQIDSREAGETAYMLSNGSGKSRARRDGSSRNVAQWRLLFLSTGEISLADKMGETGRQARAGQEVRLVDIPADAGAGMGIFEELHGFTNADIFAKTLRSNALIDYGAPIRTFLEKLTAKPGHIVESIAKARADFINDHVPRDASGQVHRVASRFALIAAAGTLATAMGILPWPADEAVNSVGSCFRSWLEDRGTAGGRETLFALRQVRKFFQNHGNSRFQDWDSPTTLTVNRAGFKKQSKAVDGTVVDTEFFVLSEVFRSEICAGMDASFVAGELVRLGHLIPGNDGRSSSAHRLPGMAQTSRVYRLSSAILEGSDD